MCCVNFKYIFFYGFGKLHLNFFIIIEKIFLYGSYAKGNYRKDSDIDLAVISPNFREEDCIENMTSMLCKVNKLKADIQTIPFSIEEYNNPKGIMEEILRTGIELKVA